MQHAIAHMLGGSFGVEHGVAHAVVLPYVTAHLRGAPGPMGRIAAAVGARRPAGFLWDLVAMPGCRCGWPTSASASPRLDRAVRDRDHRRGPRRSGRPAGRQPGAGDRGRGPRDPRGRGRRRPARRPMKIIMIGEAADHEADLRRGPGPAVRDRRAAPGRAARPQTTPSSPPMTWWSRCAGHDRTAGAVVPPAARAGRRAGRHRHVRAAARDGGRERLRARDPDRGVRARPAAGMGDPAAAMQEAFSPAAWPSSTGTASRTASYTARRSGSSATGGSGGPSPPAPAHSGCGCWPSTTRPRRTARRESGHRPAAPDCRTRATTWCSPARSPRRPPGSSTPRCWAGCRPRGAGQHVAGGDRRRGRAVRRAARP